MLTGNTGHYAPPSTQLLPNSPPIEPRDSAMLLGGGGTQRPVVGVEAKGSLEAPSDRSSPGLPAQLQGRRWPELDQSDFPPGVEAYSRGLCGCR